MWSSEARPTRARAARDTALPRALTTALLAALLAGCATPPPADPVAGPSWTGRLALRVAATTTRDAQSVSGGFELRGSGERGELALFTPLGTQLAAARWQPGMAELQTSDGRRGFADLAALAEAVFGEALPLAAWPDWLAGRPYAGAPSMAVEGGFVQYGWQVDTSRLDAGLLSARRDAPPALALVVRLDPPAAP